jgi:hypothetical protein
LVAVGNDCNLCRRASIRKSKLDNDQADDASHRSHSSTNHQLDHALRSDSMFSRSFGAGYGSDALSTPKSLGRRRSSIYSNSSSVSSSGRRSSVRSLTVPMPFSLETDVRSAKKKQLRAPLLSTEEQILQSIKPFKALPMNSHIADGVVGDVGVPRLRKLSLTQPRSPQLATANRARYYQQQRDSNASDLTATDGRGESASDLSDFDARFSRFDSTATSQHRPRISTGGRGSIVGHVRRPSEAFGDLAADSQAHRKRQRTSLSLTTPVSPQLATKRRASIRATSLSDAKRPSTAGVSSSFESFAQATPSQSFASSLRSTNTASLSRRSSLAKPSITQPRPFVLSTEERSRAANPARQRAQENIDRRSQQTRQLLSRLAPSVASAPSVSKQPAASSTTTTTASLSGARSRPQLTASDTGRLTASTSASRSRLPASKSTSAIKVAPSRTSTQLAARSASRPEQSALPSMVEQRQRQSLAKPQAQLLPRASTQPRRPSVRELPRAVSSTATAQRKSTVASLSTAGKPSVNSTSSTARLSTAKQITTVPKSVAGRALASISNNLVATRSAPALAKKQQSVIVDEQAPRVDAATFKVLLAMIKAS